jgi:hypothetical protein
MSASSIVSSFDGLFSAIARAAAITHIRSREQACAEDTAWRGVSAVRRVGAVLQREREAHDRTKRDLRVALERAERAEVMLRQLVALGDMRESCA